MKNEFWRKPDLDEKRWYCFCRAKTNGNIVRYYYRPTIRGAFALAALIPIAIMAVYGLVGLASGLTLIAEAISRGTPV